MTDVATGSSDPRSSVRTSLSCAALFGIALLLIFYQTAWSMVSIWLRSDTYAHGFLILPISLWLIWSKRAVISEIDASPAPWVATLMLPPGFLWLVASLVDVMVIQQLALVGMLVVGVWAILGHRLAWALAFPLAFLFLSVPMGEALVPPMMEFTATSTVWLIQNTGIPVYREGLYFTLPSGNWSVVEACSGVRYIIASVTLGVLYAYLTYTSFWRRVVFVLAAIIMPVFANTLRAYIIVMLGHVSDMTVATGVDHLVYGWVFFGIVMFLLFWLGSFFREDHESSVGKSPDLAERPAKASAPVLSLVTTALLALLVAGLWPLIAYRAEARAAIDPGADSIMFPVVSGGWRALAQPPWQWRPASAVVGEAAAYYGLDDQIVGVFVQYARDATDSGEVVGSSYRFVDDDSNLRVMGRDKVSMQLAGSSVVVDQANLASGATQLLAWSWYRVGDLQTSNDYLAKFAEAQASLGLGAHGTYRIVIATNAEGGSLSSNQAILQGFMDEYDGQFDSALRQAVDVTR